ncbi:MAG TPA: PilZ domain-containing protein [Selenomonadales bacterium]|nr:PilZ domain-containing protein [Selenomonadales bacterium]
MLKVNQRLDVIITTGRSVERHPSRVEEIGKDYCLIAMPMAKSVPIILLQGTRFNGRVVVDGMVWQFTSEFLDKRIHPIPVWVISRPFDIKKIQLRAFVRIDTVLPVELQVLSEDGSQPVFAASTSDISGGGLRAVSKQQLQVGTNLKVSLDLPGTGVVQGAGVIVREELLPDRVLYAAGIKFTELAEKDRDKIIKYIFRKQLERRQKGV